MRRTYANNSANTRRTTILMRAEDQALLDTVYKGLQKFYRLDTDKPTLSAILMVTLKKCVAEDPQFLPELFVELKEACQKKPRINPWTDKNWA